jgi:hypothetical protein
MECIRTAAPTARSCFRPACSVPMNNSAQQDHYGYYEMVSDIACHSRGDGPLRCENETLKHCIIVREIALGCRTFDDIRPGRHCPVPEFSPDVSIVLYHGHAEGVPFLNYQPIESLKRWVYPRLSLWAPPPNKS